jgi:hypothetical protein
MPLVVDAGQDVDAHVEDAMVAAAEIEQVTVIITMPSSPRHHDHIVVITITSSPHRRHHVTTSPRCHHRHHAIITVSFSSHTSP